MTFNVAVIGCGLIGRRRAAVAMESGDRVMVVADLDSRRAQETAKENQCEWTCDWKHAVERNDVDAVVVSTVNKFLAPITITAAGNGKHILCEKPLGRNQIEAREMVEAARSSRVTLKTGFNHRHHPAVMQAYQFCRDGRVGKPMFIRATYGHGGRPGYDTEWRANADLAGGGELLDQGVHVIDLCRWFLGEFVEAAGFTGTYFWHLGYREGALAGERLEDNAFALIRTADGRTAQFQTSWTQWKNRFTFEVFGDSGYLIVEGLGGSYGTETLIWGRRRPESGPPIEERHEFTGPDPSWRMEWLEFTSAVRERREPLAGGEDGLKVMQIVGAIFESARTGRTVKIA